VLPPHSFCFFVSFCSFEKILPSFFSSFIFLQESSGSKFGLIGWFGGLFLWANEKNRSQKGSVKKNRLGEERRNPKNYASPPPRLPNF